MKRNNIMNNVPTGLFSPCSLTKCVSQNVLSSSVCRFQTFFVFVCMHSFLICDILFSKINDAFSIWTLTHKLHKNTPCTNPQTYPCYMHIHHTVGFSYKQTHTHTITYSPKTSTSEISGLMETHQSVTKTTATERTQIQFSTFSLFPTVTPAAPQLLEFHLLMEKSNLWAPTQRHPLPKPH